ncbi:MAG: hypothetical protein RLZZ488_477 [Pseudomonadota bacterium]|jgi:hypothetical protein
MRTATFLLGTAGIFLSSALVSCGTSLYRPFSIKDSNDALREETLIQLNQGNYDSAVESAKKLWDKDKSNNSASLYSIALASQSGVGLFDLIVNTIDKTASSSSNTSSGSSTSSGNNVFNTLESVLPTFTQAQLDTLKKAIEILDSAPEKNSSKLLFQRCLTAAIYTIPTLKNLQSGITSVQSTLNGLPTKLGTAAGGTGCSASAESISAAAAELSAAITDLGDITTDFTTALGIVGECFPSSQGKDTLNTVSQQVSKLKTAADKGCTVPATQKIGSYTLPSCLNDTINATGGGSAAANDGKIDGCELFINCTSGTCF